jgi:hypothetical protein|tara:strand:- start:750 stop:1280 length:531 start_codon:yes stop_codon:yes gene_type:complete
MTINQKLTKIQTEFKSKKSRFNSFGKYNFRSAEDILEATKPFLKELNVTVIVDEELISFDPPVMKCTAVISDGENSIQTSAVVGVDLDQKGMQMPQRYGAASSYGKKYCLGNLFLIDDTQDADATNGHGKKQEVKIAISAQQLQKAKDYVKSGGKVEAIKAKYNLTKEIEQELSTL